ncbi:MAG: DUF4198 domain-containing protein, partial [Sulfurisoma sp.]|nr:DUF4198 domain-containing protein [Sulfurisoma sp.]
YAARAILDGPAAACEPSAAPFELLPAAPFLPVKGGKVLLKALYGGKPVALTLEVSAEGKKSFFAKTSGDGLAEVRLPLAGRYLVLAHYKGKGASLVFRAGEDK